MRYVIEYNILQVVQKQVISKNKDIDNISKILMNMIIQRRILLLAFISTVSSEPYASQSEPQAGQPEPQPGREDKQLGSLVSWLSPGLSYNTGIFLCKTCVNSKKCQIFILQNVVVAPESNSTISSIICQMLKNNTSNKILRSIWLQCSNFGRIKFGSSSLTLVE